MAQLLPPKAPSLPIAQKEYSATDREQQNDLLRKYFNTLDMTFRQLLLGFNNYGVFIDTTTQQPAVINTAYPITMNTTLEAFGVSRDLTYTSRIGVAVGGIYNFQFSVQADNAGGGTTNFWIWFRKNGVDVANSASHVVVSGPADQSVPAWNYMLTMDAGDYFELVWSADSVAAQIHYVAAAAPVPAVPSVILTVQYLFPDATT